MPDSCCADGCVNRRSFEKQLKFYRIPSEKQPIKRQLWLKAIGRENWNESAINNARICSEHFISGEKSNDPCHPDFTPSIFSFTNKKSLTSKFSSQEKIQQVGQFLSSYNHEQTQQDLGNSSSLKKVQQCNDKSSSSQSNISLAESTDEHMDKIRSKASALPQGWVKEVVVRKSGASAGKSDVYYYSPDGKKCRSKPQMMQYLPEDFDIENFDFRTGVFDSKKKRPRKEDQNFGKDFTMAFSTDSKPNRQLKRKGEKIEVNVINHNEQNAKQAKRSTNDLEIKKKRAENYSQRSIKPKQLFWQHRLQDIKPASSETEQLLKEVKIDDIIKNLLPGSNNQALLNSIWYSLYVGGKVVGQHASLNALRKHPTALCNVDQPFAAPFAITDDLLRAQEKRVELARKKLAEAQDLLSALEAEEDDVDDMDE